MRLLLLSLLAAVVAACVDRPTGTLCTPGEERCNQNVYEVCAGNGDEFLVGQDCAAAGEICLTGVGCRFCDPGELACGGDGFDIVRCAADGSHADPIARCDPETGELCAGGRCENACDLLEALRSYEGCEYWATDLDNAVTNNQGPAAAQQYSIVITNPLELPASVRVEVNDAAPGQPPQLRTIASAHLDRVPGGGDLAIINLDPRELDCSSDPRLNDGSHTCLSSNAFHLVSTAPIVAYQFNPLENVEVYSNDASLLLPQSALGEDYLVMGWPQTLATSEDSTVNAGIDLRAFLTIVGTREATTVRVKLSTPIIGGGGIPAAMAGETLEFVIGPYDVINLETDSFAADFTGTVVDADKPVAVFSGGEASDVPDFTSFAFRSCCADHLEEQLFPISAFGTQFVATQSPRRSFYVEQAGFDVAVVPEEPEWWRVMASTEDTFVTTSLPPPNDQFTLQQGQFVTFEARRDFVLFANEPVSFAQLVASQQTTGIPSAIPGGDPALVMVPPVQQWREKYVFLVPNKYEFDFLLLSVPAGAEIRYDGLRLDDALDGCEYESAGFMESGMVLQEYVSIRCPLSRPLAGDPGNPAYQDDGRHTLESESGEKFGLVVYGFDRFVSYGYPGGANVDIINPQ